MQEKMLAKGIPKIRTYTDCTGRQIKFQHAIHTHDDRGFHITAAEVGGNPGYEFNSAMCATAYIAYLDVHKQIETNLKQKHLVVSDNKVSILANELAGRVGYGGLIVDGKHITFDQLRELISSYEGWEVSLKLG